MENLEELKKKYAELGAEIERIEKGQQGRWKPKTQQAHYILEECGEVRQRYTLEQETIDARQSVGNNFKTEEEAQARADKIKIYWQLYDLAERLNKGEKIDWKNTEQLKTYIYYDVQDEIVSQSSSRFSKDIGQVYCLDLDFLDKAIEEIRKR